MQQELLDKHSDADLRVYAVWFSMYEGDGRDRWPAAALTDSRVTHFWDEPKALGRWYGEREHLLQDRVAPGAIGLGGSVLWDAYLVYSPQSRWDAAPDHLIRWGRTILRTSDTFRQTFQELLVTAD